MSNLMKGSLVLGLSLVLVAVAGCGGGGPGGPNSSDPDVGVRLIVQQTLPTNGQEVLTDLSDAGEQQDAGYITIKFSERVDGSTILDASNALNGLTSDLNILRSDFTRVGGVPRVEGDRGNIFRFRPQGGSMSNGQYTVTVTRDIRSSFGARLNKGEWDYRSAFTVGPDTYAPVIRNTFPAQNQKGVAKDSQIIVTFNESLNPATVNTGTFTVVDGGTNPPTPVAGTITTSHDDFDIIFTPDPANPMPPNATIVVTISGGTSGITDRVGNPYAGDPPGTDSYQLQFETVKEPPLPNNPWTVSPNPAVPLAPATAGIYYGKNDTFGVIDETPFLSSLTDLTLWGTGNPVANSETVLKVGNSTADIGEMVVDPRFNPSDGHSWIYVTDTKNRAVFIIGSRDSRVVHIWRELPDPTGLARTAKTLYVSNTASDQVSALDISRVTPGTRGATQTLKDLSGHDLRQDLSVGRGPVGIAHHPNGNWLMVVNKQENSVTIIDSGNYKVFQTLTVGSAPVDVAMTWTYPGTGDFAFITNSAENGGEGTVSLLWLSQIAVYPIIQPSGKWQVQSSMKGFSSPQEVIFDYISAVWVADPGSDTVSKVTLTFPGIGVSPFPKLSSPISVGSNPTGITLEPWVPYITGYQAPPYAVIVAERGSGDVRFLDQNSPARPAFTLSVPGVKTVATYLDQ